MSDGASDFSALERRVRRERAARREAEKLLEEKSREVFLANQELSRLAERAQQQAVQLRTIVDHVGEGIITYNDAGRILSFNVAAEKIFGCSAIEASLIKIGDLVPSLSDTQSPPPKNLGSTESFPFEQLATKVNGTEFPIELSVSTFAHQGQRVHTALIRDRTARRQLEQKLSHAQKMESVGQLAAGIAHEINTPMQFVGDNTRFLSEVFADVEDLFSSCLELAEHSGDGLQLKQYIDRIQQAAQNMDLSRLKRDIPAATEQTLEGIERITSIILALKEFSHPGDQTKVAVDLNQSIRNSIALSRNRWKYLAEVETDLDPSLPPTKCYAGEFNQVILNLLVNAAQAIEEKPGDQTGWIRVRSRLENGSVMITVSDNGIGMTEDIRSRVFEPFFTTKPVGQGTGQGLAICYAVIVDKLGGQITCMSEPGQGTTFTIRLPFEHVRPATQTAITEQRESVGDLHILFVDDDANILQGIQRMLRSHPLGWKLHFAISGREALAIANDNPIDVVVSDMRMPQMDGAELLQQIKHDHPQVVRGIFSGQAEIKQTIGVIGTTHFYLSKPCSPTTIQSTIGRISKVVEVLPDTGVRERILSMELIPSDTEIYRQLETEIASGDKSKIASLLASDIGLSARVLQLVCSSFFGQPRSIFQVEQAVAHLDINLLRNLAASTGFARPLAADLAWFPMAGFYSTVEGWENSLAKSPKSKLATKS